MGLLPAAAPVQLEQTASLELPFVLENSQEENFPSVGNSENSLVVSEEET